MKKSKNQKPYYYTKLKALAAEHDITDTDMAKIVGLAYSTYSDKKRGRIRWQKMKCTVSVNTLTVRFMACLAGGIRQTECDYNKGKCPYYMWKIVLDICYCLI